jgi:hypothetical protein
MVLEVEPLPVPSEVVLVVYVTLGVPPAEMGVTTPPLLKLSVKMVVCAIPIKGSKKMANKSRFFFMLFFYMVVCFLLSNCCLLS